MITDVCVVLEWRFFDLVNRMAFDSISITVKFLVYVLLVRFFIFGYYCHIAVHSTCLVQYLECWLVCDLC